MNMNTKVKTLRFGGGELPVVVKDVDVKEKEIPVNSLEDAELVMLQVRVSRKELIPKGVEERKTEMKRVVKKNTGRQFINELKNTDVSGIPLNLRIARFILVDGYYREAREARTNKSYYLIRLVFGRSDRVEEEKRDYKWEQMVMGGLEVLCSKALWKVRAYKNPYFHDGEVIDGKYAVSINLESRVPLTDEKGDPVMVWGKNDPCHEGQKHELECDAVIWFDRGNIEMKMLTG